MTADRRLPLLALLWLLTAAAAGFLFAWLLRQEPDVRVVVREAEGTSIPGTDLRPARHSATSRNPPAGTPADSAGGADARPETAPGAAPEPSSSPPPPTSILVTVLTPEGTPVRDGGTVYALSPGEAGSGNQEDLCHAELTEGGTARLRIPGPGVYDIGTFTPWGTVLAQDARVLPGDAATLTLRLAGDAPVRVVCEPPWPPPAENPTLTVNLWRDFEGEILDYPGRGQSGSRAAWIEVGPDGTGASGLLPSGMRFSVSADILETFPQYFADNEEGRRTPTRQNSLRFVAEPDREIVHAGETVRVRLRPVGILIVDAEGEPWRPEGTDPAQAVNLRVEFSQGEARTVAGLPVAGGPWYNPVAKARGNSLPRPRLLFKGASGPCRLEWSGIGIRSGERDDVVLRAGEITQCTLAIQDDSAGRETPAPDSGNEPGDGVALPEPLTITVEGLPGHRGAKVYLIRRDEEGGLATYEEFAEAAEEAGTLPSVELTGVPRSGATVVAVAPPDLVSDAVPAPATGPLRVSLRPGGLLLVAPEESYPPEFGRLRVRFADGRPIPFQIGEGDRSITESGEATVSAGTLLGPFPEGRVTLQVRLGGVRLPDATATVKAGRIGILHIRR